MRNKKTLYVLCKLSIAAVIYMTAAVLPSLAAAPVPAPTVPVEGDDLFLLTTSIAPNVVMLLDNSTSMNQIEWHEKYDPTVVSATCTDWDDSLTYDADTLGNNETACSNTRKIFKPEDHTLYDGRYLNWYFSDDADPYINDIENAVASNEGCTQAGGAYQFDDKYRRTRFNAAQHVLMDLLCIAEPKGIRFALAEFRESDDASSEDPNGAFISVDIERASPSHAANLEAHVKNVDPGSEGPLGESLFQIYTYYMSRNTNSLPVGVDTVTKFPEYTYDIQGQYDSTGLVDPVQYACQKSFVLIVTDGLPTRDDFDRDPLTTSHGYDDFDDLIGDYNADGQTEIPGDADESGWYLDDIAKYANTVDMRPDFDGKQCLDIYTVGLATSDDADVFLSKTANVGGGLFFHAKNGDELSAALVAALNDIVEKAQSFTAASVPSARTVDGGDFYQSFFFPVGNSAFWEGHMRSWRITGSGDIHDKNDDCALDDPDAGECNSGAFLSTAEFFWDVFDSMPAPDSRNLLTSKIVSSTPTMLDFDTSLSAADVEIATFTSPPIASPNSLLYDTLGNSIALTAEGLADEVISYARGCFFGTGVTGAGVSATTACVQRPATFGDIFHSDPLVVRRPSRLSNSVSYNAFKTAYATRNRMIYVGTNGGFLHGILSGEWDAGATPPGYDEGTGVEQFGFMPWAARMNIKNLRVDPASARTYYVDGSPVVTDAWVYTDPVVSNKVSDGSEWHTVLVGGMRQGGRQYYALDVTNPNGITGPGGQLAYPGYLWEFPREDDPNSDLAYMGETWSKPVVTKVRVKVGANTNGGVGFERWVAIFGGGYDASGNPNDSISYDATATEGRSIFMIDIKTGKVLAQKKLDFSATDGQQLMTFAISSAPAVFDTNQDGFADVVYIGDLGGNVFKWVISDVGEDRVNDGSGLRTQPSWPFKIFFTAPVATISSVNYYKSFFRAPAGTFYSNKLWLAFGSGERNFISFEGVTGTTAENNRFYVIKDVDALETLGTPIATLTESDLTDVSASAAATSISNSGYYFIVDDGEKFVTSTEIFNFKVYSASFKPVSTGDPCTSRGEATLYVFDVRTAAGDFVDGFGDPTRKLSIGSGLPSDPKTSIGPNGKDNRIYIQKSGTDLTSEGVSNIDMTPGGLYWREIR